ncbi:hypothetical protein RRG08_040493 [Elysia crispata]|uniref:VWFA domain-containing protein n=1 Tax=Elysia crispata TaxID=231223 RepID=A0AAE1D9Z1_9GAST|nr:hypothetical protein RRG08_040493 [Elysia crispata]
MADFRSFLSPSSLWTILILGLIVSSSLCADDKAMPDLEKVTEWATAVSGELKRLNLLESYIMSHYGSKVYNKLTIKSGVTVKTATIDQPKLVQEMAKDLSEMLGKKTAALRETVRVAEDFAANYSWNETIRKEDIGYENSKELLQENVSLTFEDRFEKRVNYNFSGVHIPVEIFDGNKDILNGLNWTAALDEQFKKNAQNDDQILWQYFGSQSGFMRTYPATPWPKKKVDLYDVRRQSWYTQGSSSPKDMMILIDKSGSTHGQSLQLMQNAVKSILDTLGENDFVNIVQFAEEASFVSSCFNTTPFVQANYRNKKQLERDVDKLEASGQADFSSALKFAFEKFKEFSENENDTSDDKIKGANCNKVIMLLTDGGTDNAEDIFEQYNWPNKTVRVFTYAVGPTPNPVHAVRWMACANRGYFSQIPAMGAIRARVQNYEIVLARDKALARSRDAQWTSCEFNTFREWDKQLVYTSYLSETLALGGGRHDQWEITLDPREYIPVLSRPQVIKNKKTFEWGNIYEDYLGLGMMTTVTLPVYNTSSTSSNQTILGVVGIDVTTAQLEAKTPFDKIGPIGYSFAINPNGYVVFHPNLKTSGKYMTEPPNVDILDLEIDEENEEMIKLRKNMINGKTGKTETIGTLFLSPDQRYVSFDKATYAYTFIKNTTFSLGLSIPFFKTKYFIFETSFENLDWKHVNETSPNSLSGKDFKVLVAPWKYRKNSTKTKDLPFDIQNILDLLDKHPDPDEWDMDMLGHLYWDIKLIPGLLNFTQPGGSNESVRLSSKMVKINSTAFFVITSGGMTFVRPASEARLFESQRDPRKSPLFTRALHSKACILSADYTNDNTTTSSVTITCYVPAIENGMEFDRPAVAGERFDHSDILAIVHKAINTINQNNGYRNVLTCEDEGVNCYILDSGGFLVAGNVDDPDEWIGRFIGEFDSTVFTALNGTVYSKVEQYDFQSTCEKKNPSASAGFSSFRIPSVDLLFDVLNVGWWSSKVSWALTSFSLYSWLIPDVTVYADDDDEDQDTKCVKAFQQYYINNKTTLEHSIFCKNCSRRVTAVYMDDMNSLFVVSGPKCDECDDEKINPLPHEVSPEDTEKIVCAMAQAPRSRLRSYACYHSDDREDVSECGCCGLYMSWLMSIVMLLTIIWQVKALH